MASQALYLKWRPQTFDDVVGQEHITQTLKNALSTGRISHAYLFTGPRGTGKTTMARVLAKAVNCLDEDVHSRPCNRCPICTAVNEGRLLDLIEMDAASNTGVDNVREAIREKVGFRPNQARYKVYVIDEVHMLSTSAFNALLKTLEEPPEHVIFVLATTEPHKVLPTIISRCQRFDFKRIPLSALTARLRHIADQENVPIQEDALRFLAHLSTGCARDAIGLLDQLAAYGDEAITIERVNAVLGLGDAQIVGELVAALVARQIGQGLEVIHQAVEEGVDIRQFTQQVIDYLRSLLLVHLGDQTSVQDLDAQTRAEMQPLAQRISAHDLVRAIKLLNQAQLDLRGSEQTQIALELAFVEAALGEKQVVAGTAPAPAAQLLIHPVQVSPTRSPAAYPPQEAEPSSSPAATPAMTSTSALPLAAPSRLAQSQAVEQVENVPPEALSTATADADKARSTITLEQVTLHWPQIKQAIRAQSRQAEALVNTATLRGIEGQHCVVFELPSKLLAEKLEKAETRRLVEEAFRTVLEGPCTIRATTAGEAAAPTQAIQESPSPFDPGPVAPAPPSPPAAMAPPGQSAPISSSQPRDIQQEAMADPVVRELLKLGGRVTGVEEIEP